MKFVTIRMMARHAGKTEQGVNVALKRSGLHPGKIPGVRGLRIPIKVANQFLERQWPECGPIGQEVAK